MSWNISFLGKKIFEIPAIFSNPARGSGQKRSRMLTAFFRPEYANESRDEHAAYFRRGLK